MNRKLSAAGLVVLSLSFAGSVLAMIVPEWGHDRQCGGSSYYTGDTSEFFFSATLNYLTESIS